jgi:hypothetical protein
MSFDRDASESWSDTFISRIGEDEATDLDPTDAPTHKQDKYSLFRRLNTGEWKNRTMRDQEKVRRRDNLAIFDALAGQVELTSQQKSRGIEYLEEIPLNELGLPAEAACFAVVARVANEDVRPDLKQSRIYHPTKPQERNPDRFERVWWAGVETVFENYLNLPTVPVLFEGAAQDCPEYDPEDLPESEYRGGFPEGVVVKNYKTRQWAKIRHPKFKERHGGQSLSKDDTVDMEDHDSVVLAQRYATEARIQKWIHKYRDRGRDIEMAIMEDLWRDVFDDIIEEEYDEIFLGNHTIDTKEFRSQVASRTADVLQRYLSRPQESVLNEA